MSEFYFFVDQTHNNTSPEYIIPYEGDYYIECAGTFDNARLEFQILMPNDTNQVMFVTILVFMEPSIIMIPLYKGAQVRMQLSDTTNITDITALIQSTD